jgi:hypothetical protein
MLFIPDCAGNAAGDNGYLEYGMELVDANVHIGSLGGEVR